jgi:hypothetical protein
MTISLSGSLILPEVETEVGATTEEEAEAKVASARARNDYLHIHPWRC